jgi:two-component system nitrate/nitrite sensor histidine kinase NarX
MLAVPLQHRGQVLGVYNLFFHQVAEPGRGAGTAATVGELLGLALHNARLEARTCAPRCCTNAS